MKPYRSKDSGKTRLTYGSFFWGKSLIRRRQLGDMNVKTSDANDKKNDGASGVASTFIDRVWSWLHDIFPERQIYIRSDGRVQFFTFGPSLQATLAGLSLIFLLWVAFATVNVIFKDRIIDAKDHRYQQMQAAYENRVADLQLSYDELNGALVSAEDRFKATADELQLKQNTIVKFLDRRRQVDATLAGLANTGVRQGLDTGAADGGGDAVGGPGAPQAALPVQTQAPGASELSVNPIAPAPAPRVGKPGKQSFLDLGGAVSHITGFIFGRRRASVDHPLTTAALQHPALRELALQTARLDKIGAGETVLMTRAQGEVAEGVTSIRNVIRHTGINPDDFTRKYNSVEAIGGPDLPLADVHIEGIADQPFSSTYLKASAVLEQLNQLLGAMRHIPLTTPVWGSQFERTSGFGARVDPFTGKYSFHPGVDFAGPYGSSIAATAPGTVVYAGERGGYGNMVEVDHGFGIHTRYGHLSAILVRVNQKVSKGTPIGKLGSTGRSTGPHVHYEVWYDNVVRNPSTFIEAGHHVL